MVSHAFGVIVLMLKEDGFFCKLIRGAMCREAGSVACIFEEPDLSCEA